MCIAILAGSLPASGLGAAEDPQPPPKAGDEAADFELTPLDAEEKIKLSELVEEGPVVLIVLRGYPGYQCPICDKQVGQFLQEAGTFKQLKARVVMIYPGPSKELQKRAKEFLGGKELPAHFHLLLDPNYEFTNNWRLRWQARNETAYPSTFVIDEERKILFAKVSKTHGGRATPDEVFEPLRKR